MFQPPSRLSRRCHLVLASSLDLMGTHHVWCASGCSESVSYSLPPFPSYYYRIGDPHIMLWNGNWLDFQGMNSVIRFSACSRLRYPFNSSVFFALCSRYYLNATKGECDMVLVDAPEFFGGLGLLIHGESASAGNMILQT